LASLAAILFGAAAIWAGWPAVAVGGVLVFYAVEAQMVFLFPLLLDGSPRPWRESLRWTRRAGGTVAVMRVVKRLAMTMIFGGLAGGGFVRSWCVGCLAVCIWYERVRAAAPFCHRAARPRQLLVAAPAMSARSFPSGRRRYGRHGCREKQASLGAGAGGPLHIRVERVECWGLARPLRILYVSDLHLGHAWTRGIGGQVIRAARIARADLILLGGDLLDHAGGAPLLRRCVMLLARLAPVYAIPGNHDHRAGLDIVRDTIRAAGARWLADPVEIGDGVIELISTIRDKSPSRRTILCAHNPSIFSSAAHAAVDLVLAGHLHGGQCVLFQRGGKLYPGAWFARWTGLRFVAGHTTLLVSRGAADTLPIRWNCPREVILCEIF
jgi:predicted MPP superfamily phosphohydrolase